MSAPTGAPVSGPTGAPPSPPATDANGHAWHALSAAEILRAEHVDAQRGLSSAEAAHTMGLVTFSLFSLFFSITTGDEWRTAFSLDTFSDRTFNLATVASVLTLILATVFGPLQKLLETTSLDVQQWVICSCVALSIIVVSEIRKAIRRRAAGAAAAAAESPTGG